MSQRKELVAAFVRTVSDLAPDVSVNIAVEFHQNRTWGSCPHVFFGGHDTPIASATGCGYDKESAALASAFEHIVPEASKAHGAGVPALQEILLKHGFQLELVGWGPSFNCYSLRHA